MDDYLPISSLNQYVYCPKSAWYMFVTGQFLESADTVEGSLLHDRADSSEQTILGDLIQTRTVYLYSQTYRLIGIADLIEQNQREIYPVEYKKGRQGNWINHQIQLCAQALCLEDMLRLRRRIRRGYLYYAASGSRKEVPLTRALRGATLRAIKGVTRLLAATRPPPARFGPKCSGCSLSPICLPEEVELLNRQPWKRRKGA